MKVNSVKKVLSLALAAAMAATAVGCSNGSNSSSSGVKVSVSDASSTAASSASSAAVKANWDTSKKDTIVLSVMNNYYTSGWKKMAEEYQKLHPETSVTVDVVADNDAYSKKMTTWMASSDLKDAADIVHINFGDIPSMQKKGQCYDFTALLDQTNPYTGKAVKDCFLSEDIKSFTNENGAYALPFDHVGVGLMVNTDMLKKNGLSVPKTMEEWIDSCKKLKAAGVKTPIIASAEGGYFISCLADAAMRDQLDKIMVQPTDGSYDEKTMSANKTYKYDANNIGCDKDVVVSGERKAMYQKENKFLDKMSISVWNEYCKLAPYYNANYYSSSSMEDLSSFESGNGAYFISGSWNVGSLNADVKKMGDKGFQWETLSFPSYAKKPEGWASGTMRSLYGMGNAMGILKTHDDDHLNRVLDFYMYVYNPKGCATMFETTLNDGYFVQGPVAVQGVTLPAEINTKLSGFIQKAPMKADFGELVGRIDPMSEDTGTANEMFNKMTTGEYTAEQFVKAFSPLGLKKVADDITKNGYDLNPATKDEIKK